MNVSAVTNFINFNKNFSKPIKQQQNKTPEAVNLFSAANTSSVLADKNYNSVFIQNNPAFKASIPAKVLELGKQIPLSDRVASLFEVFKHEEIILVSKSLKEAQNALKNSYKSANQLFRRIFFIPDDNVGGTLAFIKHKQGDTELWNINKDMMFVNNDYPTSMGSRTTLKTATGFLIREMSVLTNGTSATLHRMMERNLCTYLIGVRIA